MFSSIQTYIITAIASCFLGVWMTFGFTSHYYQGQIATANQKAWEEKDVIQRKGDQLVADYIKQISQLSANNTALQRQVNLAVGTGQCIVSNGFVRLYNASATGEATSPTGTDGTTSTVDAATLLSTAIENNERYRQLANQLTKLQEFNK